MVVQEHDYPAEVDYSQDTNDSPESLHWMEEMEMVWLKIVKGAQEDDNRIDATYPICSVHFVKYSFIGR
jgi:hypothetical protein